MSGHATKRINAGIADEYGLFGRAVAAAIRKLKE
jgi:hypothetical protein